MSQSSYKKVVLAYSGGLDTSVILKWLEEVYGCEVVAFTSTAAKREEAIKLVELGFGEGRHRAGNVGCVCHVIRLKTAFYVGKLAPA